MDNMPNNYFSSDAEPKKGIPTWLGLLIIIIITAAVGAGILGYQYSISNQDQVVTETPVVKAITEGTLKNATLSFPNPYDESKNDTIKLVDGHAIIYDNGNEMPRDYTVATTAVGDLNNDGKEEGVIGIYQGYGANIIGPVVFVLSDDNDVLKQVGSVALPEETIDSEIKSLSVVDGVLSVNLLVISSDDLKNLPHSEWQPTVAKTFQYKLVDGSLVEQVDTTGWKIYKNNVFEFKYPKEWNAVVNKYNSKNVLFGPGATSESGYGGVEYTGALLQGQSLKEFVKEFNSGVESGSTSETSVIINGQSVIISILPKSSMTEKTESKSVSFEKDGEVFNMYLTYEDDLESEQRLAIFDQMLSTFKFTK